MIQDFRDLLAALVAADAKFLVVGAHALALHGAPLESLGVRERDFAIPDQVVQLGLPPFRIDLMTGISGVVFGEAWDGRVDGVLFEVPVPFLGREAFLRNKRASARPKDLLDVKALEG